jgi:signal transduction histidine kinase/CheY-like chemotaxis protein
MSKKIITVAVDFEQDVVAARQRARQIAGMLGFDGQDQARIATAVSEIARNAFRYAGRGEIDFSLEGDSAPQVLTIQVRDRGPGIQDLERILSGQYQSSTGMGMGILGARRLMDRCEIRSSRTAGTEVVLKKILPSRAGFLNQVAVGRLAAALAARPPATLLEETQQQNRDLIRTLEELRERQDDLMRLNRELEDTNRGVVALYAELDEKAEHLRRADEMKSRFLSNMSHEFRTPLHSVRALSRLLLDRVDGPLTGEQEKQLVFIRKAAEDLNELVDDLLDLAKIEAGKIEVRPADFSVANLFSALRGMLRPLLVSERVNLRFEQPENMPLLFTDEAKVSQILRNFISNALKFTERGEVHVSAALSPNGTTVSLSVRDTGIGIAEDHQEHVFEEFTQIPGPLQSKVKGTGLGLPLCRRLASLLGGRLELQSEPGLGSTFTAILPVRYIEPHDQHSAEALGSASDPTRIPVLVVEDRPETRLCYEAIFRGSSYEMVAARTLREAKEVLAQRHPAAILLDVLLPDGPSWHWLSALKSDVATRHIPVIVATTVEDERKAYALGADYYMTKPIDGEALVARLNELVPTRILVIDDDPAARYAIRKLLDAAAYHVLEAETGSAGLQVAESTHPNLIVLDLGLPDINGEQVLQHLREDQRMRAIPVVVATSRELSPNEHATLASQAQSVVSKRDLNSQILKAVVNALESAAGAPAGPR